MNKFMVMHRFDGENFPGHGHGTYDTIEEAEKVLDILKMSDGVSYIVLANNEETPPEKSASGLLKQGIRALCDLYSMVGPMMVEEEFLDRETYHKTIMQLYTLHSAIYNRGK